MTGAAGVASITERLILEVLRPDEPMTVPAVVKRVRDETNVRLARTSVYSALERLRIKSRVAYLDGADQRLWFSIPDTPGKRRKRNE